MTPTGININLKHNSKSYEKNNEQRVTRIEVESEKLKTLKNARFRHPINDMFYNLFESLGEIYKTA